MQAHFRAERDDLRVDEYSGAGFSSSSCDTSITTRRRGTPTCTAASPTPGASYIVSSMSSISRRKLVVDALDRRRELAQDRIGKGDDRQLRHAREIGKSAQCGQSRSLAGRIQR